MSTEDESHEYNMALAHISTVLGAGSDRWVTVEALLAPRDCDCPAPGAEILGGALIWMADHKFIMTGWYDTQFVVRWTDGGRSLVRYLEEREQKK